MSEADAAGTGAGAGERLVLCRVEDIPDRGGLGFGIGEGAACEHIFVLRFGARVYGYRNSCPHIGTPLDLIPGEYLTWDKSHILCRTHGARFRIHDGLCVAGPCRGERLAALRLELVEGAVMLVAPQSLNRTD